jgi:PAS domain-containing protein
MQARFNDLLEADRIFADFFKSSSVGLAVFDEQLRYRMLNPYLAATHGASAEVHLGKHVREILGKFASQVEPAIQRVLVTERPTFNVEVFGPLPGRPSGSRWIDNFFPISDSNGRVKAVGAVVVELPKHVQVNAPHNTTPLAGGVIRSWKDIAQYVGACIKTLQRWEHTYGFPVRRLNQNKGAVVFALASEVDDWINCRSRFAAGHGHIASGDVPAPSSTNPSTLHANQEGPDLPIRNRNKKAH